MASPRLVSSWDAISAKWAWVELNYRPHAYQAASYEHEIGSEVPTRLPFTNILLSMSRIYEHLAHFREHFARANGHHNGHHPFCRCVKPSVLRPPSRSACSPNCG